MRRYWGGWTLIEALVVVAIILVLAGLIYAVGAYAIDRSRQTRCVSNLRQIGIALLQYMEDHKQADWETEVARYNGISDWDERVKLVSRWGLPPNLYSLHLAGYIKDRRLLWCARRQSPNPTEVGYAYAYPAAILNPARTNTTDDLLWILQQRGGEYPIVTDGSHRRGNTLEQTVIVLRLSGRVETKHINWLSEPSSFVW
ncbi:MAG: DUF1559 domain-containing protein [Fimbriimonadales bacterium]|nr:DUF1559 domain-containing protein [Fimbriimonadales bacterium]